jgi:uncharacterized damage-inducible protein DinB
MTGVTVGGSTRDHLLQMFAHMAWADRRAIESLRAGPAPDGERLRLFAHVVATEHLWLSRIHGRPARVAVWPALTVDECAALADENRTAYDALLAGSAPDDLGRGVQYRNSAGNEYRNTVADILTHVALHGAYHRGQVATATRAAGGVPVPTDYIVFVRDGA